MACELLDCPLEGVVLGHVDGTACRGVETGTLHVFRDRHVDIDVIGDALLLVVALDLDDEADAGVGGRLYDDIDCEERLHSDIETVAHEFELAIGRDEGNQTFVLEPAQTDALMELDIVELHSLVL